MKIEKISDTQVKFMLTTSELKDRDIKLEELAISSDKTKKLFQDIMEKALDECGFDANDSPLIVEALPASVDGIIIIVTKVDTSKKALEKVSVKSLVNDLHRYKKNSIIIRKSNVAEDKNLLVYTFSTLDKIIDTSVLLDKIFVGKSTVYKYKNRFFLTLEIKNDGETDISQKLQSILNEYGRKYISSSVIKNYLYEYGELIAKSPAISTFAKFFS